MTMPTRRDDRDERRATVAAMRRRRSPMASCCGYDPTLTDVEVSPRARRAVRITLLVAVLALALLVAVVLVR